MKHKRLLCMAFALMLLGVSVTNAVAVFADELVGEPVEALTVESAENNEIGGEEVESDDVSGTADITDATSFASGFEEPSGILTAEPVLRASLGLSGTGNDAIDEEEPEEKVVVYDYTMTLDEGTKNLEINRVHNSSKWRCSVIPADDGLSCDTDGVLDQNSWSFVGGNVTATKPGVYTVVYEHNDQIGHGWSAHNEWVSKANVTVAVYDLNVTSEQDGKLIEAGTEFAYTIAEMSGDVEITAVRIATQDTEEGAETVENPVEVTDGVVDTSEAGAYTVTFTNQFGQSSTISFNVYSVEANDPESDSDDYETVADTLKDFLGEFANVSYDDMTEEQKARFDAIFGDKESLWYAYYDLMDGLEDGGEIVTGIGVYEFAEDSLSISEALKAKMSEYDLDKVTFYDIYAWVSVDGAYVGDIHELNGKATVAVMEVETPEGYERTFYVVREHNGEIEVLAEGEDFYIEGGVLYIISDKFSQYAIGYSDALIPTTIANTVKAPETGDNTEEAGSASANLSVAVVVTFAVVALGGAVIFAKRK